MVGFRGFFRFRQRRPSGFVCDAIHGMGLRHSKICGGDWRTYCPPGDFPATTSLLYRNRGDGTFEDVSEQSGIAAKKGRALGVAFADYDGDGFTDIFVSNDGMQQYLFHNDGNGTFKECALDSGAALLPTGKGFLEWARCFRTTIMMAARTSS